MSRNDFKKIYNEVVKLIGHSKTTDSIELNKLCKKLFGKQFKGVYAVNAVPKIQKNSYYIINTDLRGRGGIHWCALITGNGKTVYIYDSFGRPTKKVLNLLSKKLIKKGYKIKDSNYQQEQFGTKSAMCGQLSVAWLVFAKKYGITKALKI